MRKLKSEKEVQESAFAMEDPDEDAMTNVRKAFHWSDVTCRHDSMCVAKWRILAIQRTSNQQDNISHFPTFES